MIRKTAWEICMIKPDFKGSIERGAQDTQKAYFGVLQ